MVIVILAVLGAAVIFAAGYVAGSGGYGSADLTVSTDAGGPGTPCDVLCRKWKQRRAEACSALMASDMAAKAQAAANATLNKRNSNRGATPGCRGCSIDDPVPRLGNRGLALGRLCYRPAVCDLSFGQCSRGRECGGQRSQWSHESTCRSRKG